MHVATKQPPAPAQPRLAAALARYLTSEWVGICEAKPDWPQLQATAGFGPAWQTAVAQAAGHIAADAPASALRLGDWPALAWALRRRLAAAPDAATALARLQRLRAWRGYPALLRRTLSRDGVAHLRPAEHRALEGLLRRLGVVARWQQLDHTWQLPAHNAVLYVRDCHLEGHGCSRRSGRFGAVDHTTADRRAARYLGHGQRVFAVWACVLRHGQPWTRAQVGELLAGWLASQESWDEVG